MWNLSLLYDLALNTIVMSRMELAISIWICWNGYKGLLVLHLLFSSNLYQLLKGSLEYSFFIRLWNSLPTEYFTSTIDLNCFKSGVNTEFLSFVSFESACLYAFLIFFLLVTPGSGCLALLVVGIHWNL